MTFNKRVRFPLLPNSFIFGFYLIYNKCEIKAKKEHADKTTKIFYIIGRKAND